MAQKQIKDLPEVKYTDVRGEFCFYVDFDAHFQPLSRISLPDLIKAQQKEIDSLRAELKKYKK